MAKVDSKGRVVLPKELRDRLGISPGTEVELREADGQVVIEPERDPEDIVARTEELLEDAARGQTRSVADTADIEDPHARKHAETIRRQAESTSDGDE